MFNFDDITNENNKGHNSKWPYIPGYSYRILITGGSGKTNVLFNLINEQNRYKSTSINKMYLYAEDLNEQNIRY